MTTHTCVTCGFTGDEEHFKSGPRGRKIHDECQNCKNQLSKLVDENRMIRMYFQKYVQAFKLLSINEPDLIQTYIKSNLTPSYAPNGQFLGSLQNSHFVPISHLAFDDAKADLVAGVNLIKEIESVLGSIAPITLNPVDKRKNWERDNLKNEITTFNTIPTGKGLSSSSVKPNKKSFLRKLLGL